MLRIVLLVTVMAVATASFSTPYSCRKASGDDSPHGANETVEYVKRAVRGVRGTITYLNDEPAADVVVELYEITEKNKTLTTPQITRLQDRKAACVTAKDGSCFPDLRSGNYVLRAGTRSSNAGMNEVYMRVTVDRRWWTRWFRSGKLIRLALTPGT